MLEITFGEIEDGWAETTFDFGKEQRLTLALSYMTELFGDLADLTLCMLRGEASGIAAFTDEYDHYKLSFQRQPDSLYFLRLERWHPWSLLPSEVGRIQTYDWDVKNAEPWHFGYHLWSELERVKSLPGVLRWMNDEDAGMPGGHFNQARNAKITSLEKALLA